jgi:hypothetical protein
MLVATSYKRHTARLAQAAVPNMRDSSTRLRSFYLVWSRQTRSSQADECPRQSTTARSKDDPPSIEESSSTDPRGRGLLRINNRTYTSKGHKAYGEGPSSPYRQSSAASDPAYNERDQAGLAIERDDSSLQRESETERFGPTAREPSLDSTPLARLKLEGKNPESGRSNKRNRTSCSRMHNVSLHRCIGRKEASSSRGGPEGRHPNPCRPIRGDRVGQDLLCASS